MLNVALAGDVEKYRRDCLTLEEIGILNAGVMRFDYNLVRA